MSDCNQHQNFETGPRQLAFGQSSRAPFNPEEAAAEHWQEVYRLAKELRQRPKRRDRKAWARQRVQSAKRQGRHQDGQHITEQYRARNRAQNREQNRQQELLPQHPALPELEFTTPHTKDLRAMKERDTGSYRLTNLRLSEPARNHHLYDETIRQGDSSQAGRAICRHLIAALRIQHAEEQQQLAQSRQSEIQ
jgi:hypothetical protein